LDEETKRMIKSRKGRGSSGGELEYFVIGKKQCSLALRAWLRKNVKRLNDEYA